MVKNLMPEVAKLLGVELGEAFYIKDFGTLYRFTLKGLEYQNDDDKRWYRISSCLIEDLINGEREIKKPPFIPKANEDYFYVGWLYDGEHWRFCIETTYFDATETRDNLNVDTGNCFRTREEAEAAQFDVFERLTGKKWEEVFGCKAGEAE